MNNCTITPKLHDLPIQIQDGRVQIHLLTQPPHSYLIIGAYGHQRAHMDKDTKTTSNTIRKALITTTNQHIKQYWRQHPKLQLLILGDLQHTVKNHLHRSTPILPPPPHNILDFATTCHQLNSVIPHRHPNKSYYTRIGNHGSAGIDHIMAPQNLANAPHSSGINHTPRTHAIPSNHALIYADFPLQLNTDIPTHHPETKYLYKAVASIPLTLHTNPQNPNEQQFIPDGKLMTEEEHDQANSTITSLHNAHNQPAPQRYLK